ncbi:uncharacterized protein N7515_008120 [Penicillium bovifimosum]|uniref:BTB domain transcription factor n=1 Tax=Penicillium bovifimosum TaxID=126998 RepID=A0A9W9GMB9_9EURO|nr:uncharacterized protein N7515_008120 [Penicillium bovifimosum]KAJ5124295.1 hypothetical protein N7515_008120 [Penicillium bovifimosum]
MPARTSSRQAAQKAKEAISSSAEPTGKTAKGTKRKGSTEGAPAPKKEKTTDMKPEEKKEDEAPPTVADAPQEPKAEEAPAKTEKPAEGTPPKEQPREGAPEKSKEIEAGLRKSEERENVVSSNILEKGFIYFFFRPRVNIEDPQSIGEVARSFFVLRPTPLGAEFDENQGSVDKDASCRLMMLPKKKFPTSAKERDMGFVEKAGKSMKELHENFIAGTTYQTSTRGERHTEDAKPYAEGVYAITSTPRASHLAYILTIPAELGEVQQDFGLQQRGSWIIQSKNPKFPGPPMGQLPKTPEYPDSVLEKFGDLRWVPLQPEFMNYPNAQFLMIGEAQNELGKAASSEGGKQPHEEEPGQELEKLEDENEHRVDALSGDDTVFQDLGYDAKNYPELLTTWNS